MKIIKKLFSPFCLLLCFILAWHITADLGAFCSRISDNAFFGAGTAYLLSLVFFPAIVFLLYGICFYTAAPQNFCVRAVLKDIHAKTGLPAAWLGIFLFVLGSISLYRGELTLLMQKSLHAANRGISLEQKQTALHTGLELLQKNAHSGSTWKIFLPNQTNPIPAIAFGDTENSKNKDSTIPFDGKTKKILQKDNTAGASFLYRMHIEFFGAGKFHGRILVCLAALLLLCSLYSGIACRKNFFKNFFRLRTHNNAAAWYDIHCLLGNCTFPFAAIFIITGLLLFAQTVFPHIAAEKYGNSRFAFIAESKGFNIPNKETALPFASPADLSIQALSSKLLQKAEQTWQSGASQLTITFEQGSIKSIQAAQAQGKNLLVRGRPEQLILQKNAEGFDLTLLQPIPQSTLHGLWHAGSAVHLSRFASPALRLLFFVFGIASAAMMAAGLIFWEIKHQTNNSAAYKTIRAVNTLIITGLPLAICVFMLTALILPGQMPQKSMAEAGAFFCSLAICGIHAYLFPKQARKLQCLANALAFAALPCLCFLLTEYRNALCFSIFLIFSFVFYRLRNAAARHIPSRTS